SLPEIFLHRVERRRDEGLHLRADISRRYGQVPRRYLQRCKRRLARDGGRCNHGGKNEQDEFVGLHGRLPSACKFVACRASLSEYLATVEHELCKLSARSAGPRQRQCSAPSDDWARLRPFLRIKWPFGFRGALFTTAVSCAEGPP